ncbi:MAG: PKD domain-containing protein [Verrucomicrobiae bacterium]|nr:PKD domain-containing protein [Verrucomicrobiae bacterium]
MRSTLRIAAVFFSLLVVILVWPKRASEPVPPAPSAAYSDQPAPDSVATRSDPPPPTVASPLPDEPLVDSGPAPLPASATVDAALRAFDDWRATLGRPGDAWSEDRIAEGTALARARREALRQLIPRDPKRALAAALSWSDRQGLPEPILAELEEWIAARGQFEVWCATLLPGRALPPSPVPQPGRDGSSPELWGDSLRTPAGDPFLRGFTLPDRSFQAFVYGRRRTQQTADPVTLFGIAIDDLLAVHEEPARILDPAEATARHAMPADAQPRCGWTGQPIPDPSLAVIVEYGTRAFALADGSAAGRMLHQLASSEPGFIRPTLAPGFRNHAQGIKRLLFMRARFPDDLREPISEAEAAEVMQAANDYFVAGSFNTLSIISTVGPLVTLPQPKLYYGVRGPGALLRDARAATRSAGIEPDVFDLDMVRFENVPGFNWGGLAAVGGRGLWLQSSSLGVICHELGHNLGLLHANFWNTVRPDLPDNPQNLPFDPDSLVGLDSILGPGDDIEYGDPTDVMGQGGDNAHFTALHKTLLGWIPATGITEVSTTGAYRVMAHDAGVLDAALAQVLRVRKDAERAYWISARSRFPDNPWLANGIQLHWNNWHQAIGSSQLLDTTPGSGHGTQDAAVVLGRTFADPAAGVFITPLARGTESIAGRAVPYFDVFVALGSFPDNRPPELELVASATQVAVGQPVEFHASAGDPDGDPVAFSWDLGNGLPGPSQATVTHQWDSPGDYVVRCEVTDLRGGRAARHTVVRVGFVNTLRISGQVLDPSGQPLLGVRVHNGLSDTNRPYAEDYRWAYTDTDGRYTLTGLPPGEYPVGAVLDGYQIHPLNFRRPLILNEFTGVNVNFIAAALPEVNVSRVADGSESPSAPAVFRVARSGTAEELLRVFFRVAGTATPGIDYTPWPLTETQINTVPTLLNPVEQSIEFSYVDLPPGILATNLSFPVLTDSLTEGDESLVVTLAYPVSRTVEADPDPITFDIPGWEVLSDNGQNTWFQTRPPYRLGPRDEAVARLLDAAPPGPPVLSIVALDPEVSENAGDSATFLITRSGGTPPGELIIPLDIGGTATPGEDYLPLPSPVRMSPDAETLRLIVEVLEDDYIEGNETVLVRLLPGAGYTLGNAAATVTIVDNDLPQVTVTALDPVFSESSSGARVAFQRSGNLARPLEVDYLLAGTATAGLDYIAPPGRIVIPAGASSAILTLVPINDTLVEGDETIEIRIGDSPAYNVAIPGQALLVLLDDQFPTVTVEATVPEITEGGDPGQFVVRRTGPASQPLTVLYRLGGSAIHQADYVASGDRIVIPAGLLQAAIPVIPIDDAIREDDETIDIELLPDPAYNVGSPSRAAILLLDNDDSTLAVGFALLSSSGPESLAQPEIAVRISGNPDEGDDNIVTVAWEILGGSATRGVDYTLTNGTLSFAYLDPEEDEPLANRLAFIPLLILDDDLPEPDETILIRLRIAPTLLPSDDPESPPNLVTNGVLDVYAVHTYTILDDDLASVRVVASNPVTAEGSDIPGRFTIERTGRTNTAQTVLFHLSGSASPGSDYLDVPRFVTLPPGRLTAEVLIVPIDDPIAEYRENVVLTLVHAPGAAIGSPSRAEVFIDDNDGTLEFAAARWTASESDGSARIAVRRTGKPDITATASYQTLPGTAVPAVLTNGLWVGDYLHTEGTLTFAPGVLLQEFEVPLVDNDRVDGLRTVLLSLTRGSDQFPLGGQNSAILTILDDDSLLSAGTNVLAAVESDPEAIVTLERTGPIHEPLVVNWVTADLTATAGQDYVASEGTLTFPAGSRSATLFVPLLNDFEIEGDEVFVVRLFRESGTPVGEVPVIIVDDDCAIEFATDHVEIDEDAGTLEVTVLRRGGPIKPVAVDYATVPGTATPGEDYLPVTGTLLFLGNRFETLTDGSGLTVFREGETNLTVRVPIINDSLGEPDETFRIVLSNPRPGNPGLLTPFVTLGSPSEVTVTLRDTESPGRVDDTFQPGFGADATVRALAIQPDGKIVVGGDFQTLDGVVLPRLGRLHADGFLDRSFNPGSGLNGSVLAIAPVADGRLLVGGTFSIVDGTPQPHLTRLEPDGTRAADFNVPTDGPVRALARNAAGNLYAGGDFTRVAGTLTPGIARFLPNGDPDPSFATGSHGRTGVVAVAHADVGAWAGGTFPSWGQTGARFLVRLAPDGTPDPSFPAAASPDGPVHALASAPDGSLYVAGAFAHVGGLPRTRLARILPGGSLDGSFDPGPSADAVVLAAGLQSEGRVVIAGAFGLYADFPAGRFLRLDPFGQPDLTFFRGTGANDTVRALAVQPNGAFILGGDFTTINDRPRLRLARIHADEAFAEGFVEFATPVFTALETDGETTITVRRSGSAKTEARVTYATTDGTATAGEDYLAATGELVFAPGETERTFSIRLLDDDLPEGSETVLLLLADPVGAALGRIATATLVIADNEPALAFDLPAIEVPENAGSVQLVVRRSGPLEGEVHVAFFTEEDTATAGSDFVPASGILVFPPGIPTRSIHIEILDDAEIEGPESFRVHLADPSPGIALGSQSVAVVTLLDDDRPPTHFTLTVQPGPGGIVTPGSGQFPVQSTVQVRAIPNHGLEFTRWEGTVISADNPLSLLMDRNHVLTARFRPRSYLDDFETGDFSRLPWRSHGDAPWRVTDDTAASGRYSARSGAVPHRGLSVLELVHTTFAGGGSFDFRTDSETGWDFLEFHINGERIERWSGNLGWQTFQFNVPAGTHLFEWRFTRDPTFGEGQDAVWIDNLDLPDEPPPATAPTLTLHRTGAILTLQASGAPGRLHTLEVSPDLRLWTPLSSQTAGSPAFPIDPPPPGIPAHFYRVRVD